MIGTCVQNVRDKVPKIVLEQGINAKETRGWPRKSKLQAAKEDVRKMGLKN